MTKYEELMDKADKATEKAIKAKDVDLALFYVRASEGYKMKLEQLTLEEAMEVVEC